MIVEHRDFFDEPYVQSFLRSFEFSVDSIIITSTSPEEHFLYVNESFKRKTGYTEKELVGKSPRILQGPETDRNVLEYLKEQLRSGEDFVGQTINYRKDRSRYFVKWHISALHNHTGELVAYISFQKEVFHTHNVDTMKLLSSISNQVDQMISVTNLDGLIVYANNAFVRKSGFDEDEIIGAKPSILKSGKHPQSFYADVWQELLRNKSYHGVFINKTKNGELFFEQKTITPINNESGDIEYFVSVSQDVTALVEESDKYKSQAYQDSLTELSNRLRFDQVILQKFDMYQLHKKPFSMILLDIDNFKSVNDTYGHDKGDIVLQDLAKLLQECLRKEDLIVRWGGEEFAVVIDTGTGIAHSIAEKLRTTIEQKLFIEGDSITVSVGVSSIKESDTQTSFFKRVDDALYESKTTGKNRVTLY